MKLITLFAWLFIATIGARGGFTFTEGPVSQPDGYLLFSDPNENTIYRWSADDGVSIFGTKSGPGGLRIFSRGGKTLTLVKGPKQIHNMAWGDADRKSLYLCAHTGLYRIRLNVAGVHP